MKAEKLFSELEHYEISRTYFWNRPLIIISRSDFNKLRKYFSKGLEIGSKLNYRSLHKWKHVHAVESGNVVQIHIDHGNIFKNSLFGISHFFIDVVPYFLWYLLIWKNTYKF